MLSQQNTSGLQVVQYYGYKWNRMYEGFGTKLSGGNDFFSSVSGPGSIIGSFTLSPNNNYLACTFASGTIRVRIRAFIKSGAAEGPGPDISAASFPPRGTTTPGAINWNASEDVTFWSRNVSPYIYASTFSSGIFGTLYAAPFTAPTASGTMAINLVTSEVALSADPGILGAPAINAWTFSTSTGWGTKLSDPAAGFPTAQGQYPPAFTKNGDAIVCQGTNSPYVFVYPWTAGTGFGTKYADPADISFFNAVTGSNFNPTQTVLGLVTGTGYVQPSLFFQWSSSTGFGTKYASTPDLIGKPTWSPDGKSVGGGAEGTNTLTYPWNDSTGFGTQYSNPVEPLGAYGDSWTGFFSN